MAIESMRDWVFSSKSDVWSFGVVLWEIFLLLGKVPFAGIAVDDEFLRRLENGFRMEKPQSVNWCPISVGNQSLINDRRSIDWQNPLVSTLRDHACVSTNHLQMERSKQDNSEKDTNSPDCDDSSSGSNNKALTNKSVKEIQSISSNELEMNTI